MSFPIATSFAGELSPVFSWREDPLALFPAHSGANTNLALVLVVGRDDGRCSLRRWRTVREGRALLVGRAAGDSSVFWQSLSVQIGLIKRRHEKQGVLTLRDAFVDSVQISIILMGCVELQ